MTPLTRALLIVVAIACLAGSQVWQAWQVSQAAGEGQQVHAAMCVWKGTLQKQYDDTAKLVTETPDQRLAYFQSKVGPGPLANQLAAVPTNVLARSKQQQGITLHSLSKLKCP